MQISRISLLKGILSFTIQILHYWLAILMMMLKKKLENLVALTFSKS